MSASLNYHMYFNLILASVPAHFSVLTFHLPFCFCCGCCSVLVANNGLAAVKFMRSVRSWASQVWCLLPFTRCYAFCEPPAGPCSAIEGCCANVSPPKTHMHAHLTGAGRACGLTSTPPTIIICQTKNICPCTNANATQALGEPRAVWFLAMATPNDMRINAEHIALADQFVEVPGGSNNNNYANVRISWICIKSVYM